MIKRILIIIQRSNGDVLFSLPLIDALTNFYSSIQIDLLVNDDTYSLAALLPNINFIHKFSYKKKNEGNYKQEKFILSKIFRKYDLSINLTASDRSVVYALAASSKSISAIEMDNKKSWWKKMFLYKYYFFDFDDHILINNLKSLNSLNIKYDKKIIAPIISSKIKEDMLTLLNKKGINKFIIFHPSAQYKYKVYSEELRNKLLSLLSKIGVPIIITGGVNEIDNEIKKSLRTIPNVHDFIGKTTLEEYVVLSELSLGYVGMDTLNMHIAASQNKRIFAIFGPTLLHMWSPWANKLKRSATDNMPLQTYGNVTIFQANMACVACGNSGCDDRNGNSDCLDNINPEIIFSEVQDWYGKINR